MRDKLKLYLEENGIKQKHIAEKLGISTSLLCRYLKGTRNLSIKKEEMLKEIIKIK